MQIGTSGLAALLAALIANASAQEIAPLRNTSVQGYVGVRSVTDRLDTRSAGVPSRQAQSELREELFVMTNNYLYHPNLATLEIGGGPIIQQGRFTDDNSVTGSHDTLYNFVVRTNLLRDKPYQGGLFFEHLNPTVSIAPGQVMTQQNEQYGMNLALLEPLTPVPVRLDATHSEFRGTSTDRFVDDQVDRFTVRASRSFGTAGGTQLAFQTVDQASESGNPNIPIQHSTSRTQGLNIDSRYQLGKGERQYDFLNFISVNNQSFTLEQGPLADRRDVRFVLDARGRHGEGMQTFASYNYASNVQGALSTVARSGVAGGTYWFTPDFSATASGRLEGTEATQASTALRGVEGSLRYATPLSVGQLQTSYSARLDWREQEAASSTGTVIGEHAVLTAISFATLSREHVITQSIVVSNLTRTQTYAEGQDYAVSVVGTQTRLQRIVAGAILDGQEVLVDYMFAVGGSFAYRQEDQSATISWSYLSIFNSYFRHFQSVPHLTSGQPTFALNEIHSNIVGLRADVPMRVGTRSVVGGFTEREDRRETISPFERSSQEAYVQAEEPLSGGSLRLGVRSTRVTYSTAAPNVDLHGYDLRFASRRFWNIDLLAEFVHETDSGGTVPRRRDIVSVKTGWSYRKLSVTFDFGRTNEEQGTIERKRTAARFFMRRAF